MSKAITRLQAIITAVIIIVAAIGGGVWYWYSMEMAKPKIEIKLGVLFPVSGAMAPLGVEEDFGVKTAIDLINEKGGVLGEYPIHYVAADAKSDPAVGASEAERLITVEGVQCIVGHYSSAICMAVSEVCERYGVVDWSVGEVADAICQRGFKYMLRPQVPAGAFGMIAGDFTYEVVCPKIGIAPEDLKVAVLHEDGPYGTSCAASNKIYAEKYGFQIVHFEGYSHLATDLSSLILKVKAVEPDVLWMTSYVSDAILFLKQAKELGFKVKVFIGHGGGHGVPATAEALGDDINYIFNIDPGTSPLAIDWGASTPEARALTDEYVKRYRAKFGRDPLTHAGMGFAQVMPLLTDVLPRAIEKYGSADADAIRKAAEETDLPDGAIPCLTYGCKFQPGVGVEWEAPWGLKYDGGQNILARTVMFQWFEKTLYCVYPEKFALKDPVVPLPPESPYAAS